MNSKSVCSGILIVILTGLFSLNSFADSRVARLDHFPSSEPEVVKMIHRKQLEIQHSKEMDSAFLTLAKDANTTALITRMTAPSGIALIAWPLSGIAAAFGGGGITSAILGTGALVGTASIFVATETLGIVSTLRLPVTAGDIKRLQLEASRTDVITYSKLQNDLDRSRRIVIDRYFDGSLKNQVKDSLRLGGLSREGTYKLWLIQTAKTQALIEELAVLNDIRNFYHESTMSR